MVNGPDVSGFHLWHATLAWRGAVADALADLDLTPTQFFVLGSLSWLVQSGERPNQRALAAHAGVDAMTTSQVVRALEARGLIARRDDPDDTRAFLLAPTAAGRALVAKAAPLVRAADARFFAPIGAAATRAMAAQLQRLTSQGDDE